MNRLDKKKETKSKETKEKINEEAAKEEIINNEAEEVKNAETAEKSNDSEKKDDALNEVSQLKDKLLRTMAEFDNYKKRTQKEKESLYEYSLCEAVSKFLPVYDTLKLALTHHTEDEAFKKGVELTLKQFKEVFEKLNVVEIEALGKTFDPNLHNAVMHIDDENYGEKEIVEVMQEGYMLNDKVIRYSMVKVAN